MGWDRHKLLWDGDGTNKYVLWTTLKIKSNISHWFYLFTYCSLLWVSDIQPKSLIYTTHIKKLIAKLYSFVLRSKIIDKK